MKEYKVETLTLNKYKSNKKLEKYLNEKYKDGYKLISIIKECSDSTITSLYEIVWSLER